MVGSFGSRTGRFDSSEERYKFANPVGRFVDSTLVRQRRVTMIVDETRLEAFAQFGLGKPRDHNGGGAEHLISITKRVCITIIVIITVVSSRHWCLMASRADDPSSRCTSSDGIRYGLGKPRNDEGADACPRSGPRTRPADPSCWYARNA